MAAKLSGAAKGFLDFLQNASERANEDLALTYFRSVFGDTFTRQSDASRADGYIPGKFVLELKTRSGDWLAGLCQGLAYQNCGLYFAHVVVAADKTLMVWRVDDLPVEIRLSALEASGAPNTVGRELGRRYADRQVEIRSCAVWDSKAVFHPLFSGDETVVASHLDQFVQLLLHGEKRRQPIRPEGLREVLQGLQPYFRPNDPLAPVRAFYTMLYGWDAHSTVTLSQRADDVATIGGETVSGLEPSKRLGFKDYVEARYVVTDAPGAVDEFFAAYDVAVDSVDAEYRRRHGMYFTDLNLSRFVMWLAKDHVPNLGHDYLVIDPACGSGNLVTNWRSPLDLRHKVVSEIDPELLFAVEKRLKGDIWHQGRFTVVPQVSEGRGLNFLDRTAEDYLDEISRALEAKGLAPDKPLAFLCNPPYRGDDDQAAGQADYAIDPSITAMTGADAEKERYCCFLAQMKRVCEVASDSGLPGEPLLLLFTKSAWLTQRSIFRSVRQEILSAFEDVDGMLFNGAEFFDVKGKWPVAFTIWRFKGANAGLDPNRAVLLRDLTHLRRRDLKAIPWENSGAAGAACRRIVDGATGNVELGTIRRSIRDWSGQTMIDFKRDRRKAERHLVEGVGGLPAGDHRRHNKKTYGAIDGEFVGFMDDLTPCRVARGRADRPWFRLNAQFMDAKKNRCFSGPPTHLGFCAADIESAKPLFFWYALARSFLVRPYPMWADAEDLWAPRLNPSSSDSAYAFAMALAYAENDCVDAVFPAHNPVRGLKELRVGNPMTPLSPFSFWSTTLGPYVRKHGSSAALELVTVVDRLFDEWQARFEGRSDLITDFKAPYRLGDRPLYKTAGITEIRDFAVHVQDGSLLSRLEEVRKAARVAWIAFSDRVTSDEDVGYFHTSSAADARAPLAGLPESTPFERVLARRVALAARVVDRLEGDRELGRTKLVKILYLADQRTKLDLRMSWAREAAGPLDARAVYHPKVGVEGLARRANLFNSDGTTSHVRYNATEALRSSREWIRWRLGEQVAEIDRLIDLLRPLDTDQSEIVATLYACWNDLLLRKAPVDDACVILEFQNHWHERKRRFPRSRLVKALEWMRASDLTPSGSGSRTRPTPLRN